MTSCKWELQLFLVTSLVVGAIAFGVTDYSASWGANLWQPENFKVTGVTSLAGNKVALVGMDSATGRGRIVEVTYTASGMTNMVTTGFDAAVTPDDLAYVGNVGGGDQYYLGRYTSGRGPDSRHMENYAL